MSLYHLGKLSSSPHPSGSPHIRCILALSQSKILNSAESSFFSSVRLLVAPTDAPAKSAWRAVASNYMICPWPAGACASTPIRGFIQNHSFNMRPFYWTDVPLFCIVGHSASTILVVERFYWTDIPLLGIACTAWRLLNISTNRIINKVSYLKILNSNHNDRSSGGCCPHNPSSSQ